MTTKDPNGNLVFLDDEPNPAANPARCAKGEHFGAISKGGAVRVCDGCDLVEFYERGQWIREGADEAKEAA